MNPMSRAVIADTDGVSIFTEAGRFTVRDDSAGGLVVSFQQHDPRPDDVRPRLHRMAVLPNGGQTVTLRGHP